VFGAVAGSDGCIVFPIEQIRCPEHQSTAARIQEVAIGRANVKSMRAVKQIIPQGSARFPKESGEWLPGTAPQGRRPVLRSLE